MLKTWVVVIAFIIMMISLPFTGYTKNVIYLVFIFAFVRFATEFQRVFYTYYEATENFRKSASFTNLFSFSLLMVTIVAVALKGNYYVIAYSRLGLVTLFLLALFMFTHKKYGVVSVKTYKLKDFIIEAIPFGITTILQQNIIGNINLIIISIMLGSIYSGLFNNALVFFKVFFIIPGSISVVILPFLYKQQFTGELQKYDFAFNFINRVLGIFSFYIFMIFYLFAEQILTLVFGSKYIASVPILKIQLIAIIFAFNMGILIITALNGQVIVTWIFFFAALINIIGCIVLTKIFGLMGAAFSIVVAYFFIFVASTLYLKIAHKITISSSITAYIKLTIITSLLIFISHLSFVNQMNWIMQAAGMSLLYCILLFAFFIKKDDIRIVREALRI
jgi:O-antigen/teichoic acid export membrane protein